MIANIVDRRNNEYALYLYAVVEPSWQDNSVVGSAKWPRAEGMVHCASTYENITLQQLIEKYIDTPYPMTLYLYDVGSHDS
jgi:hypothetical protein